MNRWRCPECSVISESDALLASPNPFRPDDDVILGCPACKSVVEFVNICDQDGCNEPATIGWPSPTGYRRTCFKHWEGKGT